MNNISPSTPFAKTRLVLILTAIMLSVLSGASFLVWNSPWSPMLIGSLLAIPIGITLLFRPTTALYIAIFITFLPDGLIPSDLRSIAFDLVLMITLCGWLLQLILHKQRIIFPAPALFTTVLIIWATITLSWSPDLIASRSELVQWFIVLCFLLFIVNIINTSERLNNLMWVLAANGLVLILSGLYTVLFVGIPPDERLKVFQVNENFYGIMLLVMMIGVMWVAMYTRQERRLISIVLSGLFITLSLIFIALSGSRGSLISIGITLAAFLLWKKTRLWGMLSILAAVIAIITTPTIITTIENRFLEDEDGALGGRAVLWEAALRVISDNPWGVGIGNGSTAMIPYVNDITDLYANRDQIPSHNPLLEIGVDTGLVGIAVYLCILISSVWLFVQHYYRLYKLGITKWDVYYYLMSSIFLGYMFSWVKAGGILNTQIHFLMLALLTLPAYAPMFQPHATDEQSGVKSLAPGLVV